jgi:hypothetical protein
VQRLIRLCAEASERCTPAALCAQAWPMPEIVTAAFITALRLRYSSLVRAHCRRDTGAIPASVENAPAPL